MTNKVPNEQKQNSTFIMSPKIDYAFKRLFGDKNNTDILAALLSAIFKHPKETFQNLELPNTEIVGAYAEEKKSILDIRVKLKDGREIDIEIQIHKTKSMSKRTLYYWSKLYLGQLRSGEDYTKLEKCVTINIVDFEAVDEDKVHSCYHITEDKSGKQLTELLEVHYLELPKLKQYKDDDAPLTKWLKFINADNKEDMKAVIGDDKDMEKAYEKLEALSNDETARKIYEAREAYLKDERTWIVEAEERGLKKGIEQGIEKGIEQGIEKEKNEIARNLLDVLDDKIIAEKTGLTVDSIAKLREDVK